MSKRVPADVATVEVFLEADRAQRYPHGVGYLDIRGLRLSAAMLSAARNRCNKPKSIHGFTMLTARGINIKLAVYPHLCFFLQQLHQLVRGPSDYPVAVHSFIRSYLIQSLITT